MYTLPQVLINQCTITILLLFFFSISEVYSQPQSDESWFETAKKKHTIESYRQYLKDYPEGKYINEVSELWLDLLRQLPSDIWDQPSPKTECQTAYQIEVSVLNIRAHPRASAKLRGVYHNGDRFCGLDQEDKWIRSHQGWVHSSYLKNIEPFTIQSDLYTQYLEETWISEYLKEAQNLRESSLFDWAIRKNTQEGLIQFLNEYSRGSRASQIRDIQEDLSFEKAIAVHSVTVYDNYLKEYPRGHYKDESRFLREDAKYQSAIKLDTIEAYQDFLKEYPNAKRSYLIKRQLRKLTGKK